MKRAFIKLDIDFPQLFGDLLGRLRKFKGSLPLGEAIQTNSSRRKQADLQLRKDAIIRIGKHATSDDDYKRDILSELQRLASKEKSKAHNNQPNCLEDAQKLSKSLVDKVSRTVFSQSLVGSNHFEFVQLVRGLERNGLAEAGTADSLLNIIMDNFDITQECDINTARNFLSHISGNFKDFSSERKTKALTILSALPSLAEGSDSDVAAIHKRTLEIYTSLYNDTADTSEKTKIAQSCYDLIRAHKGHEEIVLSIFKAEDNTSSVNALAHIAQHRADLANPAIDILKNKTGGIRKLARITSKPIFPNEEFYNVVTARLTDPEHKAEYIRRYTEIQNDSITADDVQLANTRFCNIKALCIELGLQISSNPEDTEQIALRKTVSEAVKVILMQQELKLTEVQKRINKVLSEASDQEDADELLKKAKGFRETLQGASEKFAQAAQLGMINGSAADKITGFYKRAASGLTVKIDQLETSMGHTSAHLDEVLSALDLVAPMPAA